MSKILIIDAYSQIYRVFYAIRQLTNQAGEPANALYGMARLLMQLDELYPTEYGAIAFDCGKCSRRLALLPEYKGQRPPMPDALRSQVAPIRQWCQAFGWNIVERQGFEADDLINGITQQRGDAQVLILSSDKDLSQLVNDKVRMLTRGTPKNPWIEEGVAAVQAKFGVAPEQLCDYLALLGDTADNIPGISGCGPKTAAKLLNDFGSINGILEHLDQVKPPRLQETLAAEGPRLEVNRQLVQLDDALPENWSGLEGIRRRTPDWTLIRDLAQAQGFKSLLEGIEKHLPRQLELF